MNVFTLALLLICASPATTDARVETTTTQIRYTSGNALCVEGLEDGRWTLLFRNGDGRIPMPNELWHEDAFRLDVNNTAVATGWALRGAPEQMRASDGSTHCIVRLRHAERGIDLAIHTLLDGTAAMARWLEVTNRSEKPFAITALSPWAGRLTRGTDISIGYFTKPEHGYEGWFQWQPLGLWTTTITSLRGQGHDAPIFMLRNAASGEFFVGSLAYSANWQLQFQRDLKGITTFQLGPYSDAPLRVVAPGETVTTPAIHLAQVSGDLDAAVQAMQEHVRRSVLPARSKENFGLVQYVLPADLGYVSPFDERTVLDNLDMAAAIGTELFVLDAYWWDVTCDWEPSKTRFPNGLEPIINRVREKGMKFGLYLELEGGRGNVRESRVAKEHPDWLGPKDIINLAIPEAAAWAESEACRIIERYKLDLLRVDYNPEDTGGGLSAVQQGLPENNYWRYYDACYALYGRLHAKYPNLILQQCAGGGARNDLGMMGQFHESYLTDGLMIGREHLSYAGQTLAFPPEQFVILHGATGHVSPGYPENFDTILRTSYTLGTPQIFSGIVAPTLGELTGTRRAQFARYATLYKECIRPALDGCRMYHHAPITETSGVVAATPRARETEAVSAFDASASPDWFVVEFAAKDRGRGWATVVRLATNTADDTYRFRPRGLDAGRSYRVTLDAAGQSYVATGAELARVGIPVRLASAATSELLLFEPK